MPRLLLGACLSPWEGLQQSGAQLSPEGLALSGKPTLSSGACWTAADNGVFEGAHPALQQVAAWSGLLPLCSSRSFLLPGLSGRQLGVPACAGRGLYRVVLGRGSSTASAYQPLPAGVLCQVSWLACWPG